MIAAVRGGRGRLQRRRIVGRHEAHAGQQRLERRAVVLVRGHRQRAERAAVERLLERDDLRPRLAAACTSSAARTSGTPRPPRCRCCRRTRAAGPTEAASRSRQLSLQRVIEEVRRVQQRARLIGDRLGQPGWAWPSDATPMPDSRSSIRGLRCRTGARPCRARTSPAGACRSAGRAGPRGPESRRRHSLSSLSHLHAGIPACPGRAGSRRAAHPLTPATPAMRCRRERAAGSRPSTITTSPTPARERLLAGPQLRNHAGRRRALAISRSMPAASSERHRGAARRRARPASCRR